MALRTSDLEELLPDLTFFVVGEDVAAVLSSEGGAIWDEIEGAVPVRKRLEAGGSEGVTIDSSVG